MPALVATHHGCTDCGGRLYTKLTYAPDSIVYVCEKALNVRHGCKCAAPNDMPSTCRCSHVDHGGGACEIVAEDEGVVEAPAAVSVEAAGE